jgi:hypothetical protein
MKKLVCFFLFVLLFVSKIQAQQRFTAGVKLGLTTTQVEGDTYSGFDKLGVVGGAFVAARLKEKWSAQFEMIYIQKGSKHNSNFELGDYSYYLLQLQYIEVPLLIQYRYKKITFELGPGYGYLIKEKEYNEIQELTGLHPMNNSELSINYGVNCFVYKNFGVSLRYSNSLTSIRSFTSGKKNWNTPGQRNNVLAVNFTYTFKKNNNE